MTTAQQWREAAIELRRQAEIFEETARMVESVGSPALCAVTSSSGAEGEPLACGWRAGHEGPHAWASLPTFPGPSPAVLPQEPEDQR